MGYINGQLGYRDDLLISRSIVKKGVYALLEPDGLVKNSVPGFEDCEITILGSPLMGATFVDYVLKVLPNGKNLEGFGGDGVETFLYVISGELEINTVEGKKTLTDGGFVFTPEDQKLYFENKSGKDVKGFLYKRKYRPHGDHKAHLVVGNSKDCEMIDYEDMENVKLQVCLPADGDWGFDVNFNILTFHPAASHGYVETHVQEHGALLLSGKGMYNLDNDWIPVKEGDYIYMGAYCLQCCYAVGDEPLSYIYSKDCNRDAEL